MVVINVAVAIVLDVVDIATREETCVRLGSNLECQGMLSVNRPLVIPLSGALQLEYI